MKKFLILILAVTLGISATDAQQLSKREIKAQKKALQQEIAGYQAQGWTVAPGNLSMAEQITRSKSFITAMDENNEAKYVIAEATTTAETHKAAMQSAQSAVKLAAANTIHGEDYLTLLTCTPYSVNTHRLLVRGKRVPYEKPDEDTVITDSSTFQEGFLYLFGYKLSYTVVAVSIIVFVVFVVTVTILIVRIRKFRSKKKGEEQ